MKFGSLAYWIVAVIVGLSAVLLLATMEILRAFSPTYYKKACELHKKLFGFSYIEGFDSPKVSFNMRSVLLGILLTILFIILAWLCYLRLSELVLTVK